MNTNQKLKSFLNRFRNQSKEASHLDNIYIPNEVKSSFICVLSSCDEGQGMKDIERKQHVYHQIKTLSIKKY